MGQPTVGTVVLVTFPFSNLTGQKLRPALVVAKAEHEDFILCQITSKPYGSKRAICIMPDDFSQGTLPLTSFVRPDKIFTANTAIIRRSIGKLNPGTIRSILSSIRTIFSIN